MSRSIISMLNFLPNLEEVCLENVSVLSPQFSYNKIMHRELPRLRNLKKLQIINCRGNSYELFLKASLEELTINARSANNTAQMRRLIMFQSQLLKLSIDSPRAINTAVMLPSLETLEISVPIYFLQNLKFCPNLKHIKFSDTIMTTGWRIGTEPMPNIETIIFNSIVRDVDIHNLLAFYPSLIEFKSLNLEFYVDRSVRVLPSEEVLPSQGGGSSVAQGGSSSMDVVPESSSNAAAQRSPPLTGGQGISILEN